MTEELGIPFLEPPTAGPGHSCTPAQLRCGGSMRAHAHPMQFYLSLPVVTNCRVRGYRIREIPVPARLHVPWQCSLPSVACNLCTPCRPRWAEEPLVPLR